MAEHAEDGFLLYLLDMAILQANRRSRSLRDSQVRGAGKTNFSEGDSNELPTNDLVAELRTVR
jgi:hypothetical protein